MKDLFKKNKKGFTLIELLVVIAIIGLLATIAVVVLQNARAKARDARRIADVKQIQTALELYFNDMERYPTSNELDSGSIYSTSSYGTTTYMGIIPTPPSTPDGACSSTTKYLYFQNDNGTYTISYCLGGKTGAVVAGKNCATPNGISDGNSCDPGDSFSCSVAPVVKYDGGPYQSDGRTLRGTAIGDGYYRTVRICDPNNPTTCQCWLRDNLNTGILSCDDTGVGGTNYCTSYQTDNNPNVVEKYCYANNINNCAIYGGLYSWGEAMKYDSGNLRGICPSGWHIPAIQEWTNLANFLGASAGNDLKESGTSHWLSDSGATNLTGFTVLPAGTAVFNYSFSNQGISTLIWSSSAFMAAPFHKDYSAWGGIYSYPTDYASVRCIKD